MDNRIKRYQGIVIAGSIAIILLVLIALILLKMYNTNKSLKNALVQKNKDLTAAIEKAQESEKLKSSFLANMSHEIRTPLNSIMGFVSLINDESISEEERKEYEKIISKNSTYLLKLVNDILDLSRLESGNVKFSVKQYDIINICRKAMGIVSTLPHSEKVQFVFNPPVEEFYIWTDETRILQILINFLTNSIKFTTEGTIELSVKILEKENKVLMSVTDTGKGIDPDKRSKLFNRFEKVNEFDQGFGLGLAISKHLAVKLGGDIYFDETYQTGTRIFLTQPIKRDK